MKRVRSIFVAIALLAFAGLALGQDSLNVRRLGYCDTPGYALKVALAGDYAYVADDAAGGLRVICITNPAAPVEVGFLDTPGTAHGVAVSGAYAYLADWGTGLRIIDITNPAVPLEVGFYDTPGQALDVVVRGDYAYVADGYSGLRVVNIANPAAPFEVGSYGAVHNAYVVALSGNYAYIADSYVGLQVINVSNPYSPVSVGQCGTPCNALGVAVAGGYAYVADVCGGLRVINVANPAAPTEVGFYDTPGEAVGVTVAGNYAYVADGALRVVNIANPGAPFEAGFHDTPGWAFGVVVSGNIAYVGDELSGLGIYDCSVAMGDPCEGDLTVTLVPNNPAFPGSQNVTACVRIVPGLFTQVVVPVSNSNNVPTVTVTAGCASEPECIPAENWNLALPWQYDANTTSFFTTIMRAGEGCCVTLNLEYVLPVELLGFDAVPSDGQVLLRWQTASETGCDHFEIERDGVVVNHTSAAGDATGHSYSWTDRDVANNKTYHYSLWSVEANGERSMLRETEAIPRAQAATITEYALHGNYPNPFNPETEIVYDIPETGTVTIKVFDLMGREVAKLINGVQTAGQHRITFSGSALSSGVYVCQMTAGSFTASHKMMLLR